MTGNAYSWGSHNQRGLVELKWKLLPHGLFYFRATRPEGIVSSHHTVIPETSFVPTKSLVHSQLSMTGTHKMSASPP